MFSKDHWEVVFSFGYLKKFPGKIQKHGVAKGKHGHFQHFLSPLTLLTIHSLLYAFKGFAGKRKSLRNLNGLLELFF